MKELVKLAIDIYDKKTGEFSVDDANEALRQELVSLTGTDKIDYKTMRRFKPEVFEILEEALDVLVGRMIEEEFNGFAEVHNVDWGDSKRFTVENPDLFKVALIADGTNNLRRQRLENGSLTVETFMRGVKIYEEFYRFLAGRIDWVKLVNKVGTSYNNKIYTLVYQAIYDSYSTLSATYGKTGTFSSATLSDLIQHVEAAAGVEATIYGTKNALGKVTTAQVSDNMKDVYNQQGFYGTFLGTPMQKVNQVHTPGTDTFAIDNNFLLIVPQGGEKLVKIVIEGDSIIEEGNNKTNMDDSLEYIFKKKSGIAVVTASKYGIYRLS